MEVHNWWIKPRTAPNSFLFADEIRKKYLKSQYIRAFKNTLLYSSGIYWNLASAIYIYAIKIVSNNPMGFIILC